MRIGVDRSKTSIWIGENCARGQEQGGSAVSERDGTAGSFGSEFRAPIGEDDEVGGEVYDEEHEEEER